MVDKRLKIVYEEASKLFINKGYARTQINYIAHAAGISVGAIYTLFVSKKAVFDFVLKCTIDIDYIESNIGLPIKESDFVGLHDEIIKLIKESNSNFEKHLGNGSVSYGFENMLSDAFDVITKYGVGCLIFQNNGSDCGELYTCYVNFRKLFCEDIKQYVTIFIKKGEIRRLEHPQYHARLIIETLSWWGMHVKYDAFETDTDIPQEICKQVAIDALLHAYII